MTFAALILFSTVPAMAADALGIIAIQAPPHGADSCLVVRGDTQLLKGLEKLGWQRGPFPDIDFGHNVALIVTTPQGASKPDNVSALGSALTVELVDHDDYPEGTGTLVLAVPSLSGRKCSLTHIELRVKRQRELAESHGLVSVGAVKNEKIPRLWRVDTKATLPSKAPPPEKKHR